MHIADLTTWFTHAHLPGYHTANKVEHSISDHHLWGVIFLLAMLAALSVMIYMTFDNAGGQALNKIYYPYLPYAP